MQKIIIADDDTFVHGGMAFYLSTIDSVEIVHSVSNGHDVIAAVEQYPDAVLILDLGMPGRHGLDVLKDVKGGPYTNPVIVLTGLSSGDLLAECIDAGADGVLTKADGPDELFNSLNALGGANPYLGSSVREHMKNTNVEGDYNAEKQQITAREKQVMLAIASGLTASEISREMNIAVATVRKHRENLMYKLNCHNTADITAYVIKRGLHLE